VESQADSGRSTANCEERFMNSSVVEAARRAIGPVGVVLPVSLTTRIPIDLQRESVRRLEAAGYRTAWTNEVIGKDAFTLLSVLLADTERMTFGTSITNIWAREPQTVHGAAALLTEAYPDRFVLGLGVGYPAQAAATGREFGRPVATMRDYWTRMGAQTWPPAPEVRYPRIVAANSPKLMALAGEIADGALPAGLPPEFTSEARKVLGPDRLLVTGVGIIPDTDRDRARATARESLSAALSNPSFAKTLTRLGYPDAPGAVSDRLVDAIYGYGDAAAIVAKAREHLAAGADHVMLMLPVNGHFAAGIEEFIALGPALAELG
jgi:probable F420-dependent oxidoreductase